ncbi:hypothetical protein PFISCL1PPCAC_2271, partial [Pristionchus fissidentatus]
MAETLKQRWSSRTRSRLMPAFRQHRCRCEVWWLRVSSEAGDLQNWVQQSVPHLFSREESMNGERKRWTAPIVAEEGSWFGRRDSDIGPSEGKNWPRDSRDTTDTGRNLHQSILLLLLCTSSSSPPH